MADVYLRRISPYFTRWFLRWGFTANAVTWVMIATGAAAGCALLIPGILGAVLAVVLAQLQMLWDCCDGEVARWRRTFSPAGIFLDKVGHYVAESLIPIALGVRAAGGLGALAEGYAWTTLGAVLAVVIMFNKALNDMVHVARAHSGLDRLPDTAGVRAPRSGVLGRLRSAARFVPIHRLYHSVEMTLLVAVAAVVDLLAGRLVGTQVLLIVLVPAALLTVVGHVMAILASDRVRA